MLSSALAVYTTSVVPSVNQRISIDGSLYSLLSHSICNGHSTVSCTSKRFLLKFR